MRLRHCSYYAGSVKGSPTTWQLTFFFLFLFCALGICICCSPVMIFCLWRTGCLTQKLIHYQCFIWATSLCLAAWHSDWGVLTSVWSAHLLLLWKKNKLLPAFGNYCVEGLFHSTTVPPGLFTAKQRGPGHTLCLLIYMSLVSFFSLSLITCQSGTDKLMWLIYWLHGSDIGGLC